MILGTAAYMSPEQARGQAVDKRTDIWAFGCVMYEMLTGRITFAAETGSDTIAAVLEREPDWSRVPASTPATIHRLLQRCLQKDARRRLRDIGDARMELDDALSGAGQAGPIVAQKREALVTRSVVGRDRDEPDRYLAGDLEPHRRSRNGRRLLTRTFQPRHIGRELLHGACALA